MGIWDDSSSDYASIKLSCRARHILPPLKKKKKEKEGKKRPLRQKGCQKHQNQNNASQKTMLASKPGNILNSKGLLTLPN